MSDKYKEAMLEAQAELEQLEQRRATLLRLIESLKAASGDERLELTPPPGYVPKRLTEEMITILRLTTVHLDAMQIRDSLINRGVTSQTPRNLLISVHTVLGRIKDDLDVIERDGKPAYRAVPISQAVQDVFKEAAKMLAPPPRARTAPGSFAAQGFAEEDAKKRQK